MKVIEVIGVLRLYRMDALLLGLIERLLTALIKKLLKLKDFVCFGIERLKASE